MAMEHQIVLGVEKWKKVKDHLTPEEQEVASMSSSFDPETMESDSVNGYKFYWVPTADEELIQESYHIDSSGFTRTGCNEVGDDGD